MPQTSAKLRELGSGKRSVLRRKLGQLSNLLLGSNTGANNAENAGGNVAPPPPSKEEMLRSERIGVVN